MVLLIHEVKPWMLKLDLSEFSTITFDDALYSQYHYMDHFLGLGKRLIVFASTGILHTYQPLKPDNQIISISCYKAHENFFTNGDTRPYMTKEQLLDLNSRGVEIGLHGVTHKHMEHSARGMKEAMNEAMDSYRTFIEMGLTPKSMAYPFNEPNTGFLVLRRFGIEFFGSERVTIEGYRCRQLTRKA